MFDFDSGHDLGVLGSNPVLGSILCRGSAAPFVPPPPACAHSLALSQINKVLKKKGKTQCWKQSQLSFTNLMIGRESVVVEQ